ncbi:hypothetical protein CPB83DRAFT_906752 [Crepidotus variabilis]|uniref:Uncharacterized protein n=1 Tax=Crepidotus variabilis TaxID=179855 RepID=A0A9P6JQ87_9AGAR|nr:hypothetical protein CPB83DRAFT_906752 [Crepidotus variabilis]
MIHFQTFRLIVCAILSTTACISLFLGAFLANSFVHHGFGWLLVVIEVLSLLRAIYSVARRPFFSSPQSVGSEAIGLFVLCPFQLIVMLLVISSEPSDGATALPYNVLQGLSATSSAIHMAYTLALIIIGTITTGAYDVDIWMRDIESSPSPFPPDIIFAHTFPSLALRFSATRSLVLSNSNPTMQRNIGACPPECSCQGGRLPCTKHILPSPEEAPSQDMHRSVLLPKHRRPSALPHTLIRVPNTVERSAGFTLELPIHDAVYA